MTGMATMIRATRQKAVAIQDDATHREFEKRFGLKDGDYLEVDRGHGYRPARIMFVEEVYRNASGGYTARIKLATLNTNGTIGTGRGVTLLVNANGTGLKALCTNPRGTIEIRLLGGRKVGVREYV